MIIFLIFPPFTIIRVRLQKRVAYVRKKSLKTTINPVLELSAREDKMQLERARPCTSRR